MTTATAQQLELASFLRNRRSTLVRADFNLPDLRGGRALGLRREEVAYLVGVSVTWYTWLEQGRNANPSRQVIGALARELRLTAAEHAYVLALGGFGPPPVAAESESSDVPAHLRRLLDGWSPAPAFAVTAEWNIVAWNASYGALYPAVERHEQGTCNLLRSVFCDPYVREMMPHWEKDSAHFVAEFRADYATRLGDDHVTEVVERLRGASPHFDTLWNQHDIERFASRMRLFRHPRAGDLELEVHRLLVADDPDISVIVYAAVPGVTRSGALESLLSE